MARNQHKDWLRSIADLTGEALLVAELGPRSRTPRIFHVNQAFRDRTGCERKVLVGKTVAHFADRKSIELAAFKQAEPSDVDMRLPISGDADQLWRLAFAPLPADGGGPSIWVARLAAPADGVFEALERLSVGICLFDANDRFVWSNRQYQEFYAEIADLLVPGALFADLVRAGIERGMLSIPAVDAEAFLATIARWRHGEREPMDFMQVGNRWLRVEEYQAPGGASLGLRIDVTEIKDKEDDLERQVTALSEVRDHLEIRGQQLSDVAKRLSAARDEAEAASRTKSEFLARMSHELRSPLNAVIGFSEILMGELFGPLGVPQYRDYAKDIHASGTHLLEVINDILDLSKIEAGRLELAEGRVDLAATVASSIRVLKGRAAESGVGLVSEVPADFPLLHADGRKIKQILINLLSNAVKYTEEGGVVTVDANISYGKNGDGKNGDGKDGDGKDGDDGAVEVIVADTGVGISEEDLPRAMAAFGQVDSFLSRRFEGTGLGLPLTKALVELHGGSMTLESTVGVGTTVKFCLPAARVLPQERAARAS